MLRFLALTLILAGATVASAQMPTRTLVKLDPALDELIATDAKIEVLAGGFKWAEGPVWDKKAYAILFTDIPNSRIHKIDRAGKVTVFAENTAKTNGLMFGPDGRLYGCRNGERKIVAYDPDGTDRKSVV